MGTTNDKLARLNETKVSMKAAINDPTLGDRFADYPTAITDGKAYIAQKIIEKGVEASGSDTFQQLGDKVGEIQSGSIIELVNVSFIPSRKTGVLFYTDGSGHYKTIESGSNVIVRVQKNTIVSLEQSSIASNWSGDIEYLKNNSFFVYGECLINTY